MAEPTRWTNQSQPQTLYIATLLLYFNGITGLLAPLFPRLFGSEYYFFGLALGLLANGGLIACAWATANEKQLGYLGAVVLTGFGVMLVAWVLVSSRLGAAVDLEFLIWAVPTVAVFALLLHEQSREYQRIWFK
jgi:hypothetical protein